jgi:hypothetical protein
VFEEFKKKENTTIHYLRSGDLLEIMPGVSSDIFTTTIEKLLLAGKKSIKTEIKKDGYDAKWHKVPFRVQQVIITLGYKW